MPFREEKKKALVLGSPSNQEGSNGKHSQLGENVEPPLAAYAGTGVCHLTAGCQSNAKGEDSVGGFRGCSDDHTTKSKKVVNSRGCFRNARGGTPSAPFGGTPQKERACNPHITGNTSNQGEAQRSPAK